MKPPEILLSIKTESPAQLLAVATALAQALGEAKADLKFAATPELTELRAVYADAACAPVTAETAPKRGRGRPRKAATEPANETSSTPEQDALAVDKPAPEAEPELPLEPAVTTPANVVQDLTPAKAREEGIAALQVFFGAKPNAMADITKLQAKFGVKLLKDIPDDRAHEFLADAKLLTSGNALAA